MKFWDDKDANGNKLTDGRVCLVIRSAENPDMPEIRTYGKDKEEVLDKLAMTTETAQGQIHRMRKAPVASGQPPAPVKNTAAGDNVTATADLANPLKAGKAIKALLKNEGVDLDQQARRDAANRIADIAEKWEREQPDYPKDPRNDQMLMNKAALLAGHALRITAEHIDAAYEELQRREMFHEAKPTLVAPVQPRGSGDPVRNATSYQRNRLRSPDPGPAPSRESAQEARWRTILETGSAEAQEKAIRNEPGYVEWVDKQFAQKSA